MEKKLNYKELICEDPRGGMHPAVYVSWPEVERYLGERHTGDADQDACLVRGLLEAGAPAWVQDAPGWVDEEGWGLYRP